MNEGEPGEKQLGFWVKVRRKLAGASREESSAPEAGEAGAFPLVVDGIDYSRMPDEVKRIVLIGKLEGQYQRRVLPTATIEGMWYFLNGQHNRSGASYNDIFGPPPNE